MKRVKRIISLLTIVTVLLTTVLTVSAAEDYGTLKVSYKALSMASGNVASEYPQVDGISSINTSIKNAIDKYYGKYNSELLNPADGVVIKATITDDHGVYSKLEVVISLYLDVKGLNDETLTYYIDKSNYSEITKDEYEAGLAAVDEEEEEEAVEEETAEELSEEELAELLSTMVQLRSNIESLGFELVWNPELSAIEICVDEETVAILFIGEDLYIVGDTVYELGIAPELGDDGYTYVPVSFFTEIVGVEVSIDEDGNISFIIPVEEEAAVEEVTEEEVAAE